MKKTLITLLALAGVAVGADYTVDNTWSVDFGKEYTYQVQEKNDDGTLKFDENGEPVMKTEGGWLTTGTLTKPGTFWDVSKLATVDGGLQTLSNGRVHMDGGNYGNWTDDFAFSITFSMSSITAGHISEVKDGDGAWMLITINTDGNLSMSGGAGVLSGISSITSTVVKTNTEYTLTLTKIGNEMTVYLDDAKAATATFTADSTKAGVIDNISLGGNTTAGNRVPMFVSNISWGKAALVPEPATATLSLLALAGLAARRRRK